MALTPTFKGTVTQGELILENRGLFNKFMRTFEGKQIVVTVAERKYQRSQAQNNLYWSYLKIIEGETGNYTHDLHEYFKRTMLPPQEIEVLGKIIKIPASTKDLNKSDFVEYLMKIESLTDVPIPDTSIFQYAPLKNENI